MISENLYECCNIVAELLASHTVSAMEYHILVECMRSIEKELGRHVIDEHMSLIRNKVGWPPSYNPFDHMENLRFAFCFDASNCDQLRPHLLSLAHECKVDLLTPKK